ncbi:MAG TPA: deoxyguanosinetriphosphate triphosphohydrolase [Candidatus Limnocylindria bacterium]|nr:deoxyguanosinetriphosphate triphosphohydrolase [Candidatus Limnocylindria bacterium]
MVAREQIEARERAVLAPYAVGSAESRGRRHPEEQHPIRTCFQRDRDRIIHSSAFRRLEYKTQVFVNHEGDYYRTRLTHTMEAAQITRTIARVLGLNEDLAEAVALAHDLGHTPFGHAGERTLDRLMAAHGGFEHNAQSLRIVDVLEERYPSFRGLNLTWEVREGIVKHSSRYDRPQVAEFDATLAPCLEAQIVDFADEVAYTAHDVDDGLKSGMLDPDELESVSLWRRAIEEARRAGPTASVAVHRYQAVRRLIDWMVTDLTTTLLARLEREGIDSLAAVRAVKPRLVEFSPALGPQHAELKAFLSDRLYHHHRVTRMTQKADRIMTALFEVYMAEPRQLPPHVTRRVAEDGETMPRVIADYVAGMTDRFALEEYKKLFDPYERV